MNPNIGETVVPPPLLPDQLAPPEYHPDLNALVIEDDRPVDNIFSEKQHRLLTEPVYSSWDGGGEPFLALANVGLFYAVGQPALSPDVMLSLKVAAGDDLTLRANRSYYTWIVGKTPEVVIEIVSDRTGGEEGHKLAKYAWIGIPYYVIFDPQNLLGGGVLRAFALRVRSYEPISPDWLPAVGLGLKLWEGSFEGHTNTWLRWCDHDGNVIPTGRDRADKERERADKEREAKDEALWQLKQMEEKLRQLGVDPQT